MSERMDDQLAQEKALREAYQGKSSDYFSGARFDIVEWMPANPQARVLEVGCGRGGTGAAAFRAGKAGHYVGVELDAASAALASEILSEVICGNVEEMDLGGLGLQYDVLIMSEVLEHLVDPWGTLNKLAQLLVPGALVFASSPNISHRNVIRRLVSGKFDYEEVGVMDWTHLRWFTPKSFTRMFEDAGFETISVSPVAGRGRKAKLFDALTLGRLSHTYYHQIMYKGRKR